MITALTLSVFKFGKASRDGKILHDVYLIGQTVPSGTVLGSTRKLWENYSLQEYLIRYFYIAQADRIKSSDQYILVTSAGEIPSGIQAKKVNIPTVRYHLYTTESR